MTQRRSFLSPTQRVPRCVWVPVSLNLIVPTVSTPRSRTPRDLSTPSFYSANRNPSVPSAGDPGNPPASRPAKGMVISTRPYDKETAHRKVLDVWGTRHSHLD